MALTRKLLKSLGLSDEQIETVIEAHSETVDALKEQVNGLKDNAEEKAELVKERDKLKKQVDDLTKNGNDAAKVQAEFDAYKEKVEHEAKNGKKTTALEKILKEAGIAAESARKLVLKGYDLDSIELDDDGNIAKADELEKGIKAEYADLISTESTKGTPPANPLHSGGGSGMTKAEIMAIKDTKARQDAIAANPQAFGITN